METNRIGEKKMYRVLGYILVWFGLVWFALLTNMHFYPGAYVLDHGSVEGSHNGIIGRIRCTNVKGRDSEWQTLSSLDINFGKLKAGKTPQITSGSPGNIVEKFFVLPRLVVAFRCGGIGNFWIVNNEKNHSVSLCFDRFRGDPPKKKMNFCLDEKNQNPKVNYA